jgi:hypothetical protein
VNVLRGAKAVPSCRHSSDVNTSTGASSMVDVSAFPSVGRRSCNVHCREQNCTPAGPPKRLAFLSEDLTGQEKMTPRGSVGVESTAARGMDEVTPRRPQLRVSMPCSRRTFSLCRGITHWVVPAGYSPELFTEQKNPRPETGG